jgi:hypothetical protein
MTKQYLQEFGACMGFFLGIKSWIVSEQFLVQCLALGLATFCLLWLIRNFD